MRVIGRLIFDSVSLKIKITIKASPRANVKSEKYVKENLLNFVDNFAMFNEIQETVRQ